MHLLNTQAISGRKGGGGSSHTPVEEADDLLSTAYLKMLVAISEGEIKGDLTAQEIYLDDTPLASDDGSYNFAGVSWEYRPGTQDQSYISGMPEVDNESSVSVEVTTSQAWTRSFTNLSLDAVRIKLSLPMQYLYKDNGDMVGTSTQYAVDLSTDGAAYQTVVNGTFDGKTTSEYQRDHRIDLPAATSGWSIRVRRITADSTSSKLVNAFKVASFTEVIDSKLRYPNTALLYIELDSSQFNGSVPKVTCKAKGKLIRVPTTYDPDTREYSGTWAGDFKWGYCNNPAWIFYDLVLDKIYGMGNRVDATMVDKWELYTIAQYCDERVADGAGGTEPRFTCNVFIQNQQDAYSVLSDLAAVFRGITFWGNDQIFVKADVPQDDVDFVYHASNVIDGLFTYAGGSYKNRYTSCQVSWSDPQDHYSDTIEGVYDSDLVQRYGVNETQITAIGCTSQSEAHRRGRWVLLSNAKDGTISFAVGLDGYIPLPAEIIGVADPFRAGKQNGGRIHAVNGKSVTLDRGADYSAGDRLVVNLPDGTAQTRTISDVSTDKKTVTVATAFSQSPVAGAVWAIDSDTLAIQYFRVTSIAANDDGTFTVSGVQHDPNKYRFIDDGVRIESAPVTVTPSSVMAAPANIVISETSYVYQGASVSTLSVSWDKVSGAVSYNAQWRKDNGDWINVSQTSATGFSVSGIYAGVYDVRVRSVNAADVSSPWGYADSTTLNGKVGRPGTPVSLLASTNTVWAIDLTWAFPDGSGDTAYTQLQYATTSDGANPLDLTLVAYPTADYQHGPMPAGVTRWYRARLIDRIGNSGEWTGWVRGQSSTLADDYLNEIAEQFVSADDGKALLSQLETNPEAILQNALANYDTVNQQWAQFGENTAAIIQAQKVAADANSAVAALETDVTAKFEETSAAIQEKMTAYTDASGGSAIYTLKAGVNYGGVNYDAGLSVAVTVNGTAVDTRVAINADQFVMMSGSGDNVYSPFSVVNGQVFLSSGFIQDGTITNAMIGNYIQSTNFVAGSAGWRLQKSGTLEMYSTVSGSGSVKLTGSGLAVYDASGVARVKCGDLNNL
ncbi:host specificity protein [Mangrovibacter sp. MFB070]|uniref:host specificity protein J n=1 Tax=Mangrovibacter sp. MFB070 TaxID=1224318 RepID=UPI0004D8952F|nr:host specificity protein J [Mangrovibacter sp. MFB070]KEA52761.1 host specificity protein [Mangrovibacter sp. MFB070]